MPENTLLEKGVLHLTSFTTNAKGSSLSSKYKRRKRPTQNKPQAIKKMVRESHISIITLNVNRLNAPITRQIGWADENMCMYALPLNTSLLLTSQIVCNYFILLG